MTIKSRPILFSAPMVRALLSDIKTQTRRVVKPMHLKFFEQSAADMLGAWGKRPLPYGQPGDRLVVKETWQYGNWTEDGYPYVTYRADGETRLRDCIPEEWSDRLMDIWAGLSEENNFAIDNRAADQLWRPSIFMPLWASRITLEIVSVRVEQLQGISEADAIAEGCKADEPVIWWQGYKDYGEPLGLMHTSIMGAAPPDWMIEPHKMNPTPWLVRGAKPYYEILWNQINGPGSWDENPWVWVIEFKRVSQ